MLTLEAIKFFIKRAYYFVIDHWRAILGVVVACGIVLLLVLAQRSCHKSNAVIDQQAINKINSASAAERKAELQDQVERNAATVRTADNTMTIAETNVIERNRAVAAKVAEAETAVIKAKQQGRDITSEELQCVLVPTDCK